MRVSAICFTVDVGTSSSRDIPELFDSHLVPPSSSRRFIVVVESMTEFTADPSNLGICIDNFLFTVNINLMYRLSASSLQLMVYL